MNFTVIIDDFDTQTEEVFATEEEALARYRRSSREGDYSCDVWDTRQDPPRNVAHFERD